MFLLSYGWESAGEVLVAERSVELFVRLQRDLKREIPPCIRRGGGHEVTVWKVK